MKEKNIGNRFTAGLAMGIALASLAQGAYAANNWVTHDPDVTYWWFDNVDHWSQAAWPTADDVVYLMISTWQRSFVELRANDDVSVGALIISKDEGNPEGVLTVRSGARLTMGNKALNKLSGGWHKAKGSLDVDGGRIVANGSFAVCSSGEVPFGTVGSLLKVHNGGEFVQNSGYFNIQGADWYGTGGHGRCELTDDGRLVISSNASIYFGNDIAGGAGQNGGELLIDGGELLATNKWCWFHCGGGFANVELKNGQAYFKNTWNEVDGGFDFFGKGTNSIFQSGGVFSGNLSYQNNACVASYELAGGVAKNVNIVFGTRYGNTEGHLTVRMTGASGSFSMGRYEIHSTIGNTPNHIFHDFRILPDNVDGEFGVTPINMRVPYDSGCLENQNIQGHWRIHPQGGVQLVNRSEFILTYMGDGGSTHYRFAANRTGTFFGEDVFAYSCSTQRQYVIRGTQSWYDMFTAKIRPEAELAADTPIAAGKSRGWVTVPSIRASVLNRIRSKEEGFIRAKVKLTPVAKTLEEIAADIRASGLTNTVATEDGVAIDLPLDRFSADSTTQKLLLDFTEVVDVRAASAGTVITNATIDSVSFDRYREGCLIMFR